MLRLWLPFNGDLHNQGLADVTVTNHGATINNAGKIGKCYSFAKNAYLDIDKSAMTDMTSASVCFWVKFNSWNTNYDTIFQAGLGSTPWTSYYFGILRNTSNFLVFCISNGSSATNGNYRTNAIELNKWYHMGFIYSEGSCQIYIDGQLVNEYATTIAPKFSGITSIKLGGLAGAYKCDCLINDFRIYDHALSAKEIKELSKGLVLHYPLSDPYVEGTTNLITSEDCLSSTCFNGATSKYGYGTNTDIYKTVTTFEGRKGTKVYMGTSGNPAYPYVYVSNMYTSNGTNSPEYKTLSFDYYTTVSTSISPYKLGNGSGTATYKVTNTTTKTGTGTNSVVIPVEPNMWNHIEVTFHGTTDADAQWGYIMNQPSHTSDTSNFWFFANMQLEAKDHATGYTPFGTTRDENVVYDVSGYQNNGTITGSLTCSNDTPRYNVSTHISATNQKIHISNFPTSGFGNSYSFAWWGKRSSNSPMFWGFSDGVRLNGMYSGTLWNTGDSNNNPLYKIGTTTQVIAPSTGVWHHYVMTGDGTKCYVYLDGELWAEAKTYKSISGTSIYINGWDSGTSYCSSDMSISDFRIYATALSADDVFELYHTPASIASNGTLMTQGEIVEV